MPRHTMAVEWHAAPLDDATPPVRVPDELVLVGDFTLAHDGPDDGIETRAVAAAGQYPDSHGSAISSLCNK